jgi:hypothetical protein
VRAGGINIDNGEAKVVGAEGEVCGHGEIIYGVIKKFERAIIPSGNDTSRGADRGFEDKVSKRSGEEARGQKF